MVTQSDIARQAGIDVSSVNKILNRRKGPVFRKETIRLVFKLARTMGYDFHAPKAGRCKNALAELLLGGHVVGLSKTKLNRYMRIAGLAS